MATRVSGSSYLLCVKQRRNPVALELRKVYRACRDAAAAARGLVRVVDESGEDYLYPADWFVPVELPRSAARLFAAAGRR